MTLPMIHFNIAVEYFTQCDIPAEFLMGSIAPDAIRMRKDAKQMDEMKTHFGARDTEINQLKKLYLQYLELQEAPHWKWFVRGYFAHILTDIHWYHSVYVDFRNKLIHHQIPDDTWMTTYYRESHQIDYELYQYKPWRPYIWNQIKLASSFKVPSLHKEEDALLTTNEIHLWRIRTIYLYDANTAELDLNPTYITHRMVDRFVRSMSVRLRILFNNWEKEAFKDHSSDHNSMVP